MSDFTGSGAGLRRRDLLRGAAGLGAGAVLAGCSAPVLSGLGTGRESAGSLDFWNLFGGGDGVRMTEMLDGFRAAHPGTDLKAVTLAWGNPYYTKLSLATLGAKPPDVAVAHLTRAKTLIASGLLEQLPLDELARSGITPDKLDPTAWRAGLVDGKAYAIPLDTHPFVMFYNTDVCEKAGLLDSAGKLTSLDSAEKFTDAMRRAKQVTKTYGGVVSINGDSATPWRIFQSLYSQLGGQMLADDGAQVVIDRGKAMRVLTFLRSLTSSGLVPGGIDYQGAIATFANGQAGFYFQGEWEISTFQTAEMPFSMTLFPNVFGGGRYAVQADSHTLVIPKQPDTDPERRDRSLTLIKSLLDQSKTWAQGGHIPAWLPFRNSAAYRAMTPNSAYAAAAQGAVYDPQGWYSGSGSNFEIVTSNAVATVLGGQQQPGAALAQMRDQLLDLAGTPSPIEGGAR
ncbi:extracellular solute-binding protein [Mangrovihabitans endophyticus]|uniref:Sugar ABC transporter substrate-binding protein n=1 Tax=Mangrovihabitans endophyticus TaxID=1751298 RepID=A0A8J3C4Y1_9ACTN|nr:extracellular solute-binding protein [Mangrovihabitans endophyticus]GGL08944.1 sugar ABC transporter substrate-binding protein [Mangrovihabitans endophyticus]